MSVRQKGSTFAPERGRAADDFAGAEESPTTDLTAGLVSLQFIGMALRRRAWLWCATAAAGLVIGLGLFAVFPPAYQASTSIMLTHDPAEDPGAAIRTDLALSQTRAVAEGALHRLGLGESVDRFLSSYTVTVITDRVLLITISAPSSAEAVRRVKTLAAEILRFRADALQIQQRLVLATLDQQIIVATRMVKSTTTQVANVSAQASSAARRAALHHLQALQHQAKVTLAGLKQTAVSYPVTTAAIVGGSRVLDAAAPIPRAHRAVLLYPAAGLFIGLVLGLGIVVVGALTSDHLRRRDDIAHALCAPVDLSVGSLQTGRWLRGRRGLATAQGHDMQRVVAHLRNAIPAGHQSAGLAIVSVDNAKVVARCLVSLAVSYAQEGKRVVVADLSSDALAARLLGASEPGVHEVCVHDVRLVVAVPDRDDVAPVGPLHPTSLRARSLPATERLTSAYDSADGLLTLVALDPSLGGEHLTTWATSVVVMVTAGRSSPTEIHAVGEMIRLADIRHISAVLVGADKTDESLGATRALGRWLRPVQVVRTGR